MNAARCALISLTLVAPTLAFSADRCDKYLGDIRALAGEGVIALEPIMSRPRGALDQTPPKQVGCEVRETPGGRSISLGFDRPEYGADNAARATKRNYVNAGLKPDPTPEPSLGSEGFSLLTSIASERKPNLLVVVGHKGPLGVILTVQKAPRSQTELTKADVERGRALVKKALDDPL